MTQESQIPESRRPFGRELHVLRFGQGAFLCTLPLSPASELHLWGCNPDQNANIRPTCGRSKTDCSFLPGGSGMCVRVAPLLRQSCTFRVVSARQSCTFRPLADGLAARQSCTFGRWRCNSDAETGASELHLRCVRVAPFLDGGASELHLSICFAASELHLSVRQSCTFVLFEHV